LIETGGYTLNASQRGFSALLSKWRSLWLLCLLTVVTLAAFGWFSFVFRFPRGAYPVLSTVGWSGQTTDFPQATPYQWLPNGDLAHFEKGPHGKLQICYQKMDDRGPVGAVRRGPEILSPTPSENAVLSPDGQWVACQEISASGQPRTVLISTDGKTTRTLSVVYYAWMPDSRSLLIISTIAPCPLQVLHFGSPHTETLPAATRKYGLIPGLLAPNSPTFLAAGEGPTAQQSTGGPPPLSSTIILQRLDVAHPATILEQWSAARPAGMEHVAVLASMDNRHLFWACERKSTPAVIQRFRNILHLEPTERDSRVSYYLSDLHSGHMQSILASGLDGSMAVSPVWTPDNKHVSFIYKNQFYLLPIE
jgi:hypothetical protein